jgi:hypothetical protein
MYINIEPTPLEKEIKRAMSPDLELMYVQMVFMRYEKVKREMTPREHVIFHTQVGRILSNPISIWPEA